MYGHDQSTTQKRILCRGNAAPAGDGGWCQCDVSGATGHSGCFPGRGPDSFIWRTDIRFDLACLSFDATDGRSGATLLSTDHCLALTAGVVLFSLSITCCAVAAVAATVSYGGTPAAEGQRR